VADQPASRWHGAGGGPVQYFADTPIGAWAEFVRHEDLRYPDDYEGVERSLWSFELPDPPTAKPALAEAVLWGDEGSYPACQGESNRLRAAGEPGLCAPSAALLPGAAAGIQVEGNALHDGPARDGIVWVFFGACPDLVGWQCTIAPPPEDLTNRVRFLS
jgi:RES domain